MKIYKGKVEWNKSDWGNEKECVFVEFPNCYSASTKKTFKWMPTYKQLQDIKKMLDEVEPQWKKDKWEL